MIHVFSKTGWGIALGFMPLRSWNLILKYFLSEVDTEKISWYAPSVYPAMGWPICLAGVNDVCDVPLEPSKEGLKSTGVWP